MFNTSQSIKGLGQEAKNKEREEEVLVPPVCRRTLFQVCALNIATFSKAITIVTVVIIYVYRFSLG